MVLQIARATLAVLVAMIASISGKTVGVFAHIYVAGVIAVVGIAVMVLTAHTSH